MERVATAFSVESVQATVHTCNYTDDGPNRSSSNLFDAKAAWISLLSMIAQFIWKEERISVVVRVECFIEDERLESE